MIRRLIAGQTNRQGQRTDHRLLGERTGYRPGITVGSHDRHSSYSRFLRRREGERDTNVPREYRMLFRYPYRKDQGSHSTCPNQPVHRLGTIQGAPVEEAILRSFNPEVIDQALRANPHHFERFRAAYDHPREFHAYQAIKADPEEFAVLQKLGFQVG